MKICITGGAGYIGSALLERLLPDKDVLDISIIDNLQQYNFSIFTRLNTFSGSKKVRFYHTDILDSYSIKKVFSDTDVLIHLAGLNEINGISSHNYEQINHWGTSEIANAVENSSIKQVIYISSTALYEGVQGLVNEETEPICLFPYSFSILRAESQLLRLRNKCKVDILRIPEVFGFSPNINLNRGLNHTIWKAKYAKRIQIEGNGRNIVSFTFLENLISYILVLINSTNKHVPVTLAVDYSVPYLDVVDCLQQIENNLEFIFVNPHYEPKSVIIKPSDQYIRKNIDLYEGIKTVYESLVL